MARNSNIEFIQKKWDILKNEPGVFKYNLNLIDSKFLEGNLKLYCELNPDRTKLRRLPQSISSLNPTFCHDDFNFNKIQSSEIIFKVPFDDIVVTFIINQSPLTEYHSLICPDMAKSQPQKLTKSAIDFSIDFLLSLDDMQFRIGYNSPGALASVNHLHLHLMHIKCELYIERAVLQPLSKDVYRLHHTMPTEAICFIISNENRRLISQLVLNLIEYLCAQNIPHNVFITPDRSKELRTLKLFVFAREQHCIIKNLNSLNIAFCEFSGYIPVGDSKLFSELTEELVLNKIKEASGNVYSLIYNYLCTL